MKKKTMKVNFDRMYQAYHETSTIAHEQACEIEKAKQENVSLLREIEQLHKGNKELESCLRLSMALTDANKTFSEYKDNEIKRLKMRIVHLESQLENK